jgi:signal transduction histidine kinase/CheY-like chemotaxis protein
MAHHPQQRLSQSGPLEIHRQSAEKPILALDALAKLTRQFANKPNLQQLAHTILLTLSGQFSLSDSFSLLRKPDAPDQKAIFRATGKFNTSKLLQSLILTHRLSRYFLEHDSSSPVSELRLHDVCSGHGAILRHCGVEIVTPLVHNDKLLGIIGLGRRVTKMPFTSEDIELLNTLVSTITPLVASAYHFHEMTSLSAWHLDILNSVKQGAFVFDVENRLQKVNAAGFNILRKFAPQPDDVVALHGMLIDEIFPDAEFKDWARRFVKANVENRGKITEGLVANAEGVEYIYEAYLTGISGDSKFETDLIITLDDVTERKRVEKQERELRDKLERAERMESLGILAGGVAHDLNNMLGPLVGYPELILMKLSENSPVHKQVQRIAKAAQEAADVVQDLLTLARRGRYEMVPTDLNEIVLAYLDSPSFAGLTEKHPDVAVKLKLDRAISKILGSAPHLSKVFMNLIVNAFDAMPEGGELTVETSQQYLESLENGYDKVEPHDYARFCVRDTGMGIDPKDLDKIFEPYYSKKKMGTSGSGLGLSVVYGVVKDHRGYYDILSTVGKGTEFVLYFPVTGAEVKLESYTEVNYGGEEKVLVVDDVDDQRVLTSDLLSSLGYRVETVSNGREAVEYLRNHSVDVMVLDMIMEKDFDGMDAYREIIRLHPGQKTVIVSGFSATERVEKMQKLGAGPYIRKPYTREVIGKAVREELDKIPPASHP